MLMTIHTNMRREKPARRLSPSETSPPVSSACFNASRAFACCAFARPTTHRTPPRRINIHATSDEKVVVAVRVAGRRFAYGW